MPLDSDASEVAHEWLRRAKSNLVHAKQIKPSEVVWEDLCFDAQQAVEKAMKGVLVASRVEFPKTHDVALLLRLVERTGRVVPDDLLTARDLTDYAFETRYPGDYPQVTEDDYRRAVGIAELVVRWADEIITGGRS